jgi:epoxide hydrolase-like predicted phosphatase
MKNEIKCVFFDIGGVLLAESIDSVHDELNRKIGKKIFTRKSIHHNKFLTGKISEKDYYRILSDKCGMNPRTLKNVALMEYRKTMKDNKAMINLANTLRKNGYRTGIISNVTHEHKRIKRHIIRNFRPAVLSCDIGLRKPHKKFFYHALREAGAKPTECVYIEDRKEFVEAARSVGMKAIHFRNTAQCKKELRKLGVKI